MNAQFFHFCHCCTSRCISPFFKASMSHRLLLLLSILVASSHAFSLRMSTKPFALNAKMSVLSERRDEFIALITKNQKQTLKTESAALQFVVGEDTTSPNIFYVHEQFTSEQGFLDHCNTPHGAEWVKFKESAPFSNCEDPVLDMYEGTHESEVVPMRSAFCLNVELCIKPELRNEFLEVIRNNQLGSNGDEPLCLQYVYGESKDVLNTFYFHEQYAGEEDGKEGFDAHAASPHFAAWEKFASTDPFTKPPTVSFFKSL